MIIETAQLAKVLAMNNHFTSGELDGDGVLF